MNNSGTGGVLALTKIGTGTQTLSGANTYTGTTTISAGTLALSTTSTSNIASSIINVQASGTLDVTGVTGAGGFALTSGQALNNNGIVTGNVSAGARATVQGIGEYQNNVKGATGGFISAGEASQSVGTNTMSSLTLGGGAALFEFRAQMPTAST